MLSIGIDAGTQSTRGIVLDTQAGAIVASARVPHRFVEGLPQGHFEQEPGMWFAALEQVVLDCLAQLGRRREEVAAIGVSGQQHGAVLLDDTGQPVRPAKLWCDTSTGPQCQQFHERFGGTAGLIALAGNPILPGYTASKLLWVKENEPAHFERTATVLLPHDYLNFRLTGERRMEYGDASGTGLLDIRNRTWCGPLVDFIDPSLHEKLPQVGSSRLPVGLLKEELRSEWGLRHRAVVSAGGGDNMMAAIGSGNLAAGTATVSLGTSGTLFSYSPTPVVDPQGEIAAFCDSTGGWLPLLCTMNATVATEAARHLFEWDHASMDNAIAALAPGAEGLLFLPYLLGERSPNYPEGTGVFHGLTARNFTAAHFARATMEGATFALARGLNRLRELGIAPTEIRLTGGGSRSAIWQQICTDAFGIPTVCLAEPEAAALGAALQAAATASATAGEPEPLESLVARLVKVDESTRHLPFPETVGIYTELLGRYTALGQTLHSNGFL